MSDIPNDRYICKWCNKCDLCNKLNNPKLAICRDKHEYVEIKSEACSNFTYDDSFERNEE